MIGKLGLAATAALMIGGAAFAQTYQGGEPAIRPSPDESVASPDNVQAPETAQADLSQTLAQLAQDVMVAQQVGYLAADKNMTATYALLGDQMALTNSQINQRLDELVRQQNLTLPREMDPEAQAWFEAMKRMNKDQFASNLVTFVNDTYPRIISAIEALQTQVPDSPEVVALAQESSPNLRDQMQTAQQLAQGDLDQQNAQMPDNGPIQRKDDPAVIPDTTPPIEPGR